MKSLRQGLGRQPRGSHREAIQNAVSEQAAKHPTIETGFFRKEGIRQNPARAPERTEEKDDGFVYDHPAERA